MSQAVTIDIPSLIRSESHRYPSSHRLTTSYKLAEHYYPSYLRHPNQPFSSPSSVSSSSSSSSFDREEYEEESIINESSSAISVDGEFDVRIEMIRPSPEQRTHSQSSALSPPLPTSQHLTAHVAGVCERASAPPLSDEDLEEHEHENDFQQQQQQQQQQQKEEEVSVCVICYEHFEEPAELILGRNYSSEELEEIEGKEKITNFCQTCKYNLHNRCLDEYRLTKMTDILRNDYQRGYVQSPNNIAGTFGMKCLLCSKEVEKIHISMDGEINIVKIEPGASEQNQQQQQEQELQIEEIMRNRMQRRLRRRQRMQLCKNKICTVCFMFLASITLLVFIFRVI